MKNFALTIITLLAATLLASCKKEHQSIDTTPPQAKVVLLNVSDSTDYSIINELLPGKPLMQHGGTAKNYTVNVESNFFIMFAKQGIADTNYVALSTLPQDKECVFIMADNSRVSYEITDCYYPPADKAIIRYINLSNFKKMEVTSSNTATVEASYNRDKLAYGFDTTTAPKAVACNTLVEGQHTINIYDDANPTTPAYTKTGVQIDKNKVYYVYLDSKKEIKVIER